MEHDADVKVAAAGAHHEAFHRGEAHGGVHRLAVFDGADGGAASEVAADDLGVVVVHAGDFGGTRAHELVAGAVEAVAADAVFLIIFVGDGV